MTHAQAIRSHVLETIRKSGKFPVNHRRNVATFYAEAVPVIGEMGFFGMLIPREYGGMGYSMEEYVAAVETIAEFDPMAAYSINEHSTIGSLPLVLYGTAEQKARYLPDVARGRMLAAFGLTEPDHGSDVTTIDTRAVPEQGGYVITGKKLHISLASHAHLFTILAGIAQGDSTAKTAFIVERTNPNLRIGPENSSPPGYLIPVAGSVILEECSVPADAVLGQVGKGPGVFREVLDAARVGLAAVYVGSSQQALQRSIAYSKSRKSFGEPIARFQAIQFKLADMQVAIQAGRLLVRDAAGLIDTGERAPSQEAAAMAKLFVTEMARDVGVEAVQIFGGQAFLAEPPIDWYMCDAKMGEILGGTSEVMRLLIGKHLLGA